MKYYGIVEIKKNGNKIVEKSIEFENKLTAEDWIKITIAHFKKLNFKIIDHYIFVNRGC